ncbi:hypothetical protein RDI58_007930 [Solanum bulbocastanum]|jgi:hypothetical protein
MSILV